ncbi:MAG: MMPL family transporter [Candidatus Latescibacteria bacterium]|nr:MMPL family transporter [Candidatus Latescibacterota bacterium]NIO27270.1 MMPL family transporter [Candidatus Latescibacterota bacterium]NIO54794.1 MMPL family transporter [Candidatus Latescibacterota bacterium]NIT00877.1 MMPL family transporter [Candidatus Latescibacterota bacterium]NIT37800.1 MMPL family transporter [Candidatus Latescibacterota bacterium]
MRLYEFAVKKPVIVSMGLITLLLIGAISVSKLPIEFLPRMDYPFIGVYVPYPNSIPSHVERKITKPIEEVVSTLGDVKRIRSWSSPDDVFVGILFNWGEDISVLRLEVKEKIDQIRSELPDDIETIQILTFNSDDIPIMVGRISAKGKDLSGSYDLLERMIINPLKRIEGVGNVGIDGIEPKEVSVYLRLDRLKAHRADVGGLFRLLQSANLTTSAGELTSRGLRYHVRSVGSFSSLEEVENMVINQEGLRVKDIADVYYGEPEIQYGRHLNREKAIAFWVQKSSGANTVDVCRRVHAVLDRVNKDPAMEGINVLLFFDQSDQILNSIRGLRQAGLIGALFAIMVLYFFLRRWTTTLIVAIAIPFSILCTSGFLFFTGRSLNILTMMGLMLGVGLLVDNAIVVLESIFRHQTKGEESIAASVVGSKEVARAVVAATLTSIIVFAPVIITSDSTGLLTYLSTVGITISVALIFSLLVSLTLIPFLTSRILKPKEVKSSAILSRIQRRYIRALRWTALKRPFVTGFVIVPLIFVGTIFGAQATKLLRFSIEEGLVIENIYIAYDFTDNLSYHETEKYVSRVEETLAANLEELGIRDVYSYYADNDAATTIYFEDKYLTKNKLKEKRKKLREIIPPMAGVALRFGDEEGQSSGGAQLMRVTLFGEDGDYLEEIADEVKRRFELLGDLEDVRTSIETGREEIKVSLNRELASRHAITPETIGAIMNLTFRGVPLRRFQTKEREVPMTITLDPEDRVGIYNLRNLTVGMSDGKEITLGAVANFIETKSPTVITRQHQKTAVSVQGLYDDEKSKDIQDRVKAVMESIQLPLGYSWAFGDRIIEQQQQANEMAINALLALICVYMVMAALFESLLHPLVIMGCLPFASFGVVVMLAATKTAMGLMAMIGLVILIGIVVNNGIVLIDHINNFRKKGLPLNEAIIEGGKERFRPILMTAATTVLGLTPLAVGSAHVADAQYYPLARAVMGGLISSTVLTLLVLPTYYVIADRFLGRLKRIWARSKAK